MKRFQTFFMVVLLLTMYWSLPIQTSASDNSFPYVCESFEDGNKNNVSIAADTGEIMTVTPGAGDTAYALRHTVTEIGGELKIPLNSAGFAPGQNLRAGAWIRLKTETADKTVTFMLCGSTLNGEEASFDLVSYPDLAVDTWTYVTVSEFWNGVFTNGEICDRTQSIYLKVRIGTGNPKVDAADGESITYDIDDIIFEPTVHGAAAEKGINIVKNSTFADGKSSWGGTCAVVKSEDAPEGGEYAKIEATTAGWMQITQELTFAANHMYYISYWIKGEKAFNGKGEAVDTAGVYMLQSARSRVVDTNSYNTDLPGYVIPEFPVDGQWHKIEFYYQFEFKTFTNQQFNTIFRVFPHGMKDTPSTGLFGIDDIKIVDMGAVANGGFESNDHTVQKFLNPTGELNKSKVTETEQNVLGWNEEKVETQLVADIRPASTGKQSMCVSILEDGGYAYQGIGLDKADTDYKISFWAKGETEDKEGVPFSLVLDRSVSKPGGDQESYLVPEVEYYTGKQEVNTDGSMGTWRLTGDWTYYECLISNRFALKDDLTTPNEHTIPRLPFLSFNVDGNSSGTVYYLDDITIREYDPETDTDMENAHPYCTDVSFAGNSYETGAVSVRYNFHSLCGADEGQTLLRMFQKTDEGEVFICATTEKTIQIPVGLAGETIRVELVPIDDRQTIGSLYFSEYTVTPCVTVVSEITKWDENTGEISAAVTITNRAQISEEQPVTIILAVYDAKNKMVGYKTVQTEFGPSDSVNTGVILAAPPEAAKAKLYVWSGSVLAETGKTVYSKVVTRTK